MTVLGGGVLTVCPVQSAAAGQATEKSKIKADSLFANDPNLLVKPADSLSSQELFYKMMLSVLLVVVLGAAAIYVSKKFGSRITSQPGKKVRLIETVHLGQRRAVHLLKIGNQQLLIASTSESITKLADIGLTEENIESAEKSIINNQ